MYCIGQRWFSEAEPELGLGIIEKIETKTVTILFSATNEKRIYSSKTAPIKRHKLSIGDKAQTEAQENFVVEKIEELNGVLFYVDKDKVIPEMQLSSHISLSSAKDKVLAQNFDSQSLFNLRYTSLLATRKYQSFAHKGLLGAKVALLHHQAYITSSLTARTSVRALLSDEVGLGKTIEAGLILSSLIKQNRVGNALIIVPNSLVFQWFVELRSKFYLNFKTFGPNPDSEFEAENLDEDNFYIIGLERLMKDKALSYEVTERQWDFLCVDESHRLQWMPENPSLEYQFVQKISIKTPHMLLLTATPEILGIEGHFARLHLLDPHKFTSLAQYKQDQSRYLDMTKIIKKIIKNKNVDFKSNTEVQNLFSEDELNEFNNQDEFIRALIDRYGTGRAYFRNTRAHLEKTHFKFPKRVPHLCPIVLNTPNEKEIFAYKVMHLKEMLDKFPQDKFLVLCHSKQMVLSIHHALTQITTATVATFHSEQSLVERDRQAAYFAEDDGARVLLCTEIGSEGRNFEFSQHLFLFDLPRLPDLLEQRIGRLDRIGQKGDINIHVPYITESKEEALVRVYHELFRAFESSPIGAGVFYQKYHGDFCALYDSEYSAKELQKFIVKMKKIYDVFEAEIEDGRDILLEINSYNHPVASIIVSDCENYNKENNLNEYLDEAFNALGVQKEELNSVLYSIAPTPSMKIPSYPGLPEIMSISFNREIARRRDDISFMSWEHPVAQGTMDLFATSDVGNSCITSHQKKLDFPFAMEIIFKLECMPLKGVDARLYLPLTPIRVLIDAKGMDLTKKYPKKTIDNVLIDLNKYQIEQLNLAQIKDKLTEVMQMATQIAHKRKIEYIQKAQAEAGHKMDLELTRINDLSFVSGKDLSHEIQMLEKTKEALLFEIANAQMNLDSVRVITA